MKPTSINSGIIAIWCAIGAIAIVTPAMTVTPPPKSTPTAQPPLPTKFVPPSQLPATTVTPSPKPQPLAAPTTPALVAVPTLTPALLKNFNTVYEQVLAVKIPPDRQQKISQRLSREWMTNLGLRNTVLQTIALEPQILRGTPAERTQLQTKLVATLRQQVLDGDTDALWLVSFYDAAPQNWLAPGKPPLTRMTTDISAQVLCFMVNEIMGKSVTTADRQLKDAIAAKLTAEYPRIPIATKQELSKLPTTWLTFKESEWFRRSDDFREQMRIHWGQNLEAYLPEIREIMKLRRDRLTKLQTDPQVRWGRLNSIQRQAAFQKTELEFQKSIRTLAPVKIVQLNNYLNTMQVASAIGNSPTRYSARIKVK
ncbi:hypothetical protein [Chamaesiphon sp.]|uniref:hypothetical protein n=1 Tax=Chamaesiphon sp. TaxID=2814140 RepID=UPI0035940762